MGLLLGIAVAFGTATSVIRIIDSQYPVIDEHELETQQMGVYLDPISTATLTPLAEARLETYGGQVPERRWDFSIHPGRTAKGSVDLILLDAPGLWNLSIQQEVRVVFALPPGTVLDDVRELRVNSNGSCASWYDGQRVNYAYPDIQRSAFGNVVAVCQIPAVGDVDDIFFEMQFSWPDETFDEAGFGRTAGAVRFEFIPPLPSDIELPRDPQNSGYGLDAMKFGLVLDEGERLIESFPDPTGGSRGSRSWEVAVAGEDIEYLVERPGSRAWVQPMSELALLLAGVALGLIPAFLWRRS